MLPSALILQNYRPFVGEHRIPIRPLTLVFGDNNAGKSALARALPLLARSAEDSSVGVLALGSPESGAGGFTDIRTRVEIPADDPQDLALGLEWEDDDLRRAVVHFTREGNAVRIRRMILEGRSQYALKWVPYPDGPLRFVEEQPNGPGREFIITFTGLRPHTGPKHPPEIRNLIETFEKRLRTISESSMWLSGARAVPSRRRARPAGRPRQLIHDGLNAPDFLLFDDGARDRVSRWYQHHLGRELLVIDDPPEDYRVALRGTGDHTVTVDLSDCGMGPIQVLPILTSLETARERAEPGVLVFEEPESHLHPSLQRDLAQHIAQFVGDTEHRLVIETHSRAFFLGVQLAIVQGRIKPADVVAVVVRNEGSRGEIDLANFDDAGRPDSRWPPDFFSDDHHLAREIVLARQQKRPSN